MWFSGHQQKVKEKKQRRASALSRVKGMIAPGQLACEEKDEADRTRLFARARGTDKKAAKEALIELWQKYTLRLLLEEMRVGINLEQEKISC